MATTLHDGRPVTEWLNVEVQMQQLHRLMDKWSLDMDTLVGGLLGLSAVLRKGDALPQGSLEIARAQTFIDLYCEHFAPTPSMVQARNILRPPNASPTDPVPPSPQSTAPGLSQAAKATRDDIQPQVQAAVVASTEPVDKALQKVFGEHHTRWTDTPPGHLYLWAVLALKDLHPVKEGAPPRWVRALAHLRDRAEQLPDRAGAPALMELALITHMHEVLHGKPMAAPADEKETRCDCSGVSVCKSLSAVRGYSNDLETVIHSILAKLALSPTPQSALTSSEITLALEYLSCHTPLSESFLAVLEGIASASLNEDQKQLLEACRSDHARALEATGKREEKARDQQFLVAVEKVLSGQTSLGDWLQALLDFYATAQDKPQRQDFLVTLLIDIFKSSNTAEREQFQAAGQRLRHSLSPRHYQAVKLAFGQ